MDRNKRYMIVVGIRGVILLAALSTFFLQLKNPEYKVFFYFSMVIFCLFSIISKSMRRDVIRDMKMEKGYKEILEGVFPEERDKYETFVKAIGFYNRNQSDKAIEIFKRAAEHDTKDPVAFHNASTFLLRAGRVEESIEYGLKALELAPNNEETMATLALAYKMQGDEEQFAKYYQMSKDHGYKSDDLDVKLSRM